MRPESSILGVIIGLILVLAVIYMVIPSVQSDIIQVGQLKCLDRDHDNICDYHEQALKTEKTFEVLDDPSVTFDVQAEPGSLYELYEINRGAVERYELLEPYLRDVYEREFEEASIRKNLYRTEAGVVIYPDDWNWEVDINEDT